MKLNFGRLLWLRPLDSALVVSKNGTELTVYLPNEPADTPANESAVIITAAAVFLTSGPEAVEEMFE